MRMAQRGSKMHHNTRMFANLLNMNKINLYCNITPSLTGVNDTCHLHTLGTTINYRIVMCITNILQSKVLNLAKYPGLYEVNGELLELSKATDKWWSKRFPPGAHFPSAVLLLVKWGNCGQRGVPLRACQGLFLGLFTWGWTTSPWYTPTSMDVQRAAAKKSVGEGVWIGLGCVDWGAYSYTWDRDLYLYSFSESRKY